MALNIENIVTELEGATILELADLVSAIEEKFGVSAAAPVAAAGAAAGAAEEKDSFDVVLTAAGDKKVGVIKVVREITGLGLKEAKDLVDGLGTIKEGASKADADAIVAKIAEAGGTAEAK
ncbi:MAG: 50S ribosomal protein L7/L12 [Streptococcaceae bacterium]|jgi:large subunit ribosomal protein L7/L12|nr:50S ribosomal protein L7/L12 [Streptococcaceae bacterium]